ncbi:MAG: SDR family NAD(P)-dependent oxidoreductase [Tatlockia sp.]|jgi:short-subunit dehydrogenase
MLKQTWVILGATSIIAESFALRAASADCDLLLVGRDSTQLAIIAADIQLRYQVKCEVLFTDFAKDITALLDWMNEQAEEFNVLIAFSSLHENPNLNPEKIAELIHVNVQSTVAIIHAYLKKPQTEHRLIFLSSVAACRGRAKNSLYGATKAAVDTYLTGLQQAASKHCHITIARLGFIDTIQTFGKPGIFYASPPMACAKACWNASYNDKKRIYHPFFWRYILAILCSLPFFLYRKMADL